MDILGIPAGELRLRDSNPGRVALRPGGVGRNVAERIVRLGTGCTLLTAFGNDTLADSLCAACGRLGIDISHALTADGATGTYLCLHDETGDMLSAVNDMAIMQAMTPEYAARVMPVINGSCLCVLDANPPVETVFFVVRHAKVPVLMDPVSIAKLDRARAALPYLAAIKPNIHEAQALTGCTAPEDCARALVRMGAKRAFVSLGAAGICYADAEICGTLPVKKPSAAPKTGAGDALCAGLAVAMAQGKTTLECAEYGMCCAADYLEK